MIQRYAKLAYRSDFLRAAAVLTTGSFFAQLIPLIFLPMLTRLFGPAMFGIQALLQTGGSLLAPLATGQYEYAITHPRLKRRAVGIVTIACCLMVAICSLVLLAIAGFREAILGLFHIAPVGYWAYGYPVVVAGLACVNIANFWLLRVGKYSLQSLNKLVMAMAMALIALAAGMLGYRHGLLVGLLGGFAIGGAVSLYQAYRHGLRINLRERRHYLQGIAYHYRQFPLYGGLPSVINNFASQIPLLIITASYSLDVTGHYAVARTILNGGVYLLAVCIGQVIIKHIADMLQRRERVWPHYKPILLGLIAFGCCMVVGVYFIGPWFFALYLGKDWIASADITRILAINVAFWFVGSTVSHAAIAIQRMKVIALWQVTYGVMACGLFLFRHLPFEQFLWRIVGLEMIAYTLYALFVTLAMRRFDRQQRARVTA